VEATAKAAMTTRVKPLTTCLTRVRPPMITMTKKHKRLESQRLLRKNFRKWTTSPTIKPRRTSRADLTRVKTFRLSNSKLSSTREKPTNLKLEDTEPLLSCSSQKPGNSSTFPSQGTPERERTVEAGKTENPTTLLCRAPRTSSSGESRERPRVATVP